MKLRFGTFTLDSDRRQLLSGAGEVHLSAKAFDLLCALLERQPNVVSKAELHARLWPDTHVVDANLAVLIGEVRRALSDSASTPQFIRTVHSIGYAFCGSVESAESRRPAMADDGPRCWLTHDGRRIVLTEGDSIIGRDPRSDIWIDAEGVSRRHARIRVARDGDVFLEDLGSTNGTFVGRTQLTSPRALKDGDVIRVGSATLPFRIWSERAPAATKRIRAR